MEIPLSVATKRRRKSFRKAKKIRWKTIKCAKFLYGRLPTLRILCKLPKSSTFLIPKINYENIYGKIVSSLSGNREAFFISF
jgi:hypothetical protein